jgi:anti-sigma-K factor RskA
VEISMNKHSQNKPNLGRIYRQSAADALQYSVASSDADLLAQAASGVLSHENREKAIAAIAGSAINADLYRLLQVLQPASTELAQDLAAQSQVPNTVVPFKRAQPVQHMAALRSGRTVMRWASFAVAAAVVAAVMIAAPRSFKQVLQTSVIAQQQIAQPPVVDEIFRAETGSRVVSNRGESNPTAHHSDTIFNSNNVGIGDKIFSARFNGS